MNLGIVVIGRNEGERLVRCLNSVTPSAYPLVYVDSGSTDSSVDNARSSGADVVMLDTSLPFTMARGRNVGFRRLLALHPEAEYVQFVDGDCEVVDGWLEHAHGELESRPDVAMVCGRRRERSRGASVFNRLIDMEWAGPAGEVKHRIGGGDVMMRVTAYQDVNGYNETMIAGEDPEICVRLRLRGWHVIRLHTDMTIHDAAITRFSQWWLRSLRGGHSCAEKAHLHRHTPGHPWRRETRSAWLWGLLLPFAILLLIWPTRGLSLLALVAYLIWILRIALARRRHFSDSWRDASLYALFCMLGKCPWAIGQLRFWRNHLRGHPSALIEYK